MPTFNRVEHERALLRFLGKQDAYWKWDNHRHLALLTSGKVSDVFLNCTPVFADPLFQGTMVNALLLFALDLDGEAFRAWNDPIGNQWVVGSAMGAIGLAQTVAHRLHQHAAYTEPDGGGMGLKRFDLGPAPRVLVVEDVFTTGGTTQRTMRGIVEKHPDVEFYPKAFALVNRAPQGGPLEAAGHTVQMFGLADVEAGVWGSMEDVPEAMRACVPVRPKQHWRLLTTEKFLG